MLLGGHIISQQGWKNELREFWRRYEPLDPSGDDCALHDTWRRGQGPSETSTPHNIVSMPDFALRKPPPQHVREPWLYN